MVKNWINTENLWQSVKNSLLQVKTFDAVNKFPVRGKKKSGHWYKDSWPEEKWVAIGINLCSH